MKNTKLRVVSLFMVLITLLMSIFTGCSESKESEESEGGLKTYQEYDEDGKLIKETIFYGNSDVIYMIREYGKNGEVTKESFYDENVKNKLLYYFLYEHNENQTCVKSTFCSTRDFDFYGVNSMRPPNVNGEYVFVEGGEGEVSIMTLVFRSYENRVFFALEMSRKRIIEYDNNGKITKFLFYDENDALVSCSEWEYNEDGNLVKITRYNKEGKPTEINTYGGKDEYVHRQEPISVVKFTFNDDGSLHYSQERNEDGVTVKYIYYNSDDTVNHYAEYERGEWGVVKKKTVYGADGTIDHYIENEYDEHGVIIRKSEFNADGTVRNYCVYDNVYAYRGEELIGYESVTMTKYNSDNTVDHYVVYGYDENLSYPLHPISEIVYKADGKVDSYAEYSDEDQNWSNGGERKTVYDAGRDMLYYVVTQDDSYEHIKTETKYSPDGNVIEVIKTIY